jgi:LmbE family N-acetylglucosaminyl deacetylase
LPFGPDGAYGHPDHIAVSQFATAAIVAAADAAFPCDGIASPQQHVVSKLYYIAWPESTWKSYQSAFRKLVSTVDGIDRQAVPWPDWAITKIIETLDNRSRLTIAKTVSQVLRILSPLVFCD